MEEKKNIQELAMRYFEGRILREDEKQLFDFIEQSEDNRAKFRQWEKQWISSAVSDSLTNAEWRTLQRKIRTYEAIIPMLTAPDQIVEEQTVPNQKPPKFTLLGKIAAVAVIVILTIGGTLGILHWTSLMNQETYFLCETPYGEKSKVILSDGTIVWLNAGSTLKYSNKFNAAHRKVELNGEGYFEVTKKNGANFIVQTHQYDVIVKGTKFDVSAYTDDPLSPQFCSKA